MLHYPQEDLRISARRRTRNLVAVVVLFGAMIALASFGLQRSANSARGLRQTGAIRNEVEHLRSGLEGAETGQRGFLLTANSEYLKPYYAALRDIPHSLQALRVDLQDQPAERERLAELDSLVKEKLTELAQTLELERTKGVAEALKIVRTDRGNNLMARAREILAEISAAEEKRWQDYATEGPGFDEEILLGLVLLSLGTGTVLFRAIWREFNLRKEAYRALSEIETRHQLAVEAAKLGTWSWDVDKDEWLWTTQCKSLYGLASETPVNREVFERALHADDRQRVREAIEQSVSKFAELDVEYRTVWPDGSAHWLRAKGRPRHGEQGQGLRFHGIVIDVDERELTLQALRASEKRYTALFSNRLNAVAHCRSVYDEAGNPVDYVILEVNEAFELITGLKKEEIENNLVTVSFPGIREMDFDFVGTYGRIAKGRGEGSFELYFPPTQQWLTVYAYSPAECEFVTIFSDITARKNAEAAVQRSEERFRLAQAATGVGVWEWDVRSGQINFSSELFYLLDVQPGAVQTQADWRRCIHAGDIARVEAERARLISEGGMSDLEYRVILNDGRLRWIHERGSMFRDGEGTPSRVLGVAFDVSERKNLEEGLRQLNNTLERQVTARTEELASANRELEAFCYSVSHDLRSPLRGIDGFARILLTELGPQLEPKPKRYFQLIRDSAKRMGELIDDLLQFSRLSRQPLEKQIVEPRKLVQEILEELKDERNGREVQVSIGELPACQAEPKMLKQVWFNLLSNAIKFTSKKNISEIEVGFSKPDQAHVTYFVKDNGAGFDMKYSDKLFGIFQRMHRAEDYEGTGVGLAIVARIVSRHGGEVHASAVPDEGAIFSFTLDSAG